jgi:hypothetical protein
MQTVRRLATAIVGCLLLFGTLAEGYVQSVLFYKEHYVWPMEKYGVLSPLNWKDVVFLIAFWVGALVLLYLSYWLLKRAFRRESTATVAPAGADRPAAP